MNFNQYLSIKYGAVFMKTRACFKCSQYVDVDILSLPNQDLIKRFEKDHQNHGILTLEKQEVIGRYTDVYLLYARV